MARYKRGDKVIVRSGLIHGVYNELGCVGEMPEMAGQVLTITAVDENNEWYYVKENNWRWSNDMVMPFRKVIPCTEDNLKNIKVASDSFLNLLK